MEETRELKRSPVISIFRGNPFRVLRLDTDISPEEAIWKAEKVGTLLRIGHPLSEPDPIPWLPEPDESEVAEAIQKIEEPFERLVSQLFWFDINGDPAKDLLERALHDGSPESIDTYIESQIEDENGDTSRAKAIHSMNSANLSILIATAGIHGLIRDEDEATQNAETALKWAKKDGLKVAVDPHKVLAKNRRKDLGSERWSQYWQKGLEIWMDLLEEEDFENYLLQLIERLEDELLTEDDIETLTRSVSTKLLDLLVGELKLLASFGHIDCVRDLTKIAAESQLDPQQKNTAFRALLHFFDAELVEIEGLVGGVGAPSVRDFDLFLNRLKTLKKKWKTIDRKGLIGLNQIIDDSILRAITRTGQMFQTGTTVREMAPLIEKAKSISEAPSLRDRIETDFSHIVGLEHNTTCHYCSEKTRDKSFPVVLKSRRVVDQRYEIGQTVTYYQNLVGYVPRCERCADIHNFVRLMGRLCFGAILISGFFAAVFFADNVGEPGMGVAFFIISGGLALLVAKVVRDKFGKKLSKEGDRHLKDIKTNRGYTQMQDQGFFKITADYSKDAVSRAQYPS